MTAMRVYVDLWFDDNKYCGKEPDWSGYYDDVKEIRIVKLNELIEQFGIEPDENDDYNEYCVLVRTNGRIATFRNSHIDIHCYR